MIKELQYTGYATEPSDYESPDGQLAMSLNLISEDNQLKPVFQPKHIMQLEQEEDKVIFLHKTDAYTHYIIASDDVLRPIYAIDKETQQKKQKDREVYGMAYDDYKGMVDNLLTDGTTFGEKEVEN